MGLAMVIASAITAMLWSCMTSDEKPLSKKKKSVTFVESTTHSKIDAEQDLKKLPFPNGPASLPFLGNIVSFFKLSKRPDEQLLLLARRFGGMCMLWFGLNPVLIISSPEAAKDLLDKRGAIYSSRPAQNSFRAEAWPWRLVTTPTGETFRLLRRLYSDLLSPQQSAKFRNYQDYESKVMMKNLLDTPRGFLLDAERFAMSVIFSATYGVRLADLKHPIMVEFYAVWDVMLRYFQPGSLLIDFLPVLQWLPHWAQTWRTLAANLRRRETLLHRAFLRTLKEQAQADSSAACFGASLVQIQEREGISDERACDILAMLIGAGADTTSSYLQIFFKVMALHPQVVAKAHEELDAVIGTTRLPSWNDERALPYVRALIKEIHRWAPIGSLGVPHASTEHDIYKGTSIPSGTIIFPNLTALCRSPERYSDPDTFDPTRFLADDLDAAASALHSDWRRRDHFHYGFGRRLCQGIFVAEASLFIFVSRVLWGFDIKPAPGIPPLDMDDKIVGLLSKPKPYELTITPRSERHAAVIRAQSEALQTDVLDFDDIDFVPEGKQQAVGWSGGTLRQRLYGAGDWISDLLVANWPSFLFLALQFP